MDEIERMLKLPTALEAAQRRAGLQQPKNLPPQQTRAAQQNTTAIAARSHTNVPATAAAIVLGTDQASGKPITLGVEELFAGTHAMGIPRHGKSAMLINIFLSL